MKRLIVTAAALLLLTGCAGTEHTATVQDAGSPLQMQPAATENQQTETTAPAETAAIPAETEQAVIPAESWREGYAKVLCESDAKRFSLVYIDDDDIPEMTIHRSSDSGAIHAEFPNLYIYYDGCVRDLGQMSDGGLDCFGYVERTGIVVCGYWSTGGGTRSYHRLENGALTELDRLTCAMAFPEQEDYTVNGAEATKEEYEAVVERWERDAEIRTTGEYPATEAGIRKYLLGEAE